MIDHDRLFKELLTTFFVEFVELFLPDVAAYLERNSIEFLDKEVFTDVTSGDKHEADIIVRARFRDQDAFFILHVENQASPQEEFGRRMFRYFARLHEKYGLPVYPIALFSYEAPRRPEPDDYAIAFPDLTVLEFRYRVIQLNRLNWRDFMRHQNPVAAALMAKMRIAPQDRWRVKLECLRLLATLHLNPAKMKLISGFVDTYLVLDAEEQEQFQAEMETLVPTEQEEVMEIVTSWLQEGLEKGMQQGLQQGELRMVERRVRRQFGTLEPAMQERLAALTTEQLEALDEALPGFADLGDLAAWLDSNMNRS